MREELDVVRHSLGDIQPISGEVQVEVSFSGIWTHVEEGVLIVFNLLIEEVGILL